MYGEQQTFRFAIPARARNSDPETSHAAAESLDELTLSKLQGFVLDWFKKVRAATDEELRMALGPMVPGDSTLRKRRCDLVELGLLRDSGLTRTNSRKRQMIVWEIAT